MNSLILFGTSLERIAPNTLEGEYEETGRAGNSYGMLTFVDPHSAICRQRTR